MTSIDRTFHEDLLFRAIENRVVGDDNLFLAHGTVHISQLGPERARVFHAMTHQYCRKLDPISSSSSATISSSWHGELALFPLSEAFGRPWLFDNGAGREALAAVFLT